MVGRSLAHYQITAAIGAGGMGEVCRARDTRLNRDVAIKVLPAAFAADADRLARFTREAQALAALNHPNIATIHGVEESDGTRALVMELVPGDDLAQLIARGPVPVAEALPMARQIAEALETAHEHGIVHRDLKPAIAETPDWFSRTSRTWRSCRRRPRRASAKSLPVASFATRAIACATSAKRAWLPQRPRRLVREAVAAGADAQAVGRVARRRTGDDLSRGLERWAASRTPPAALPPRGSSTCARLMGSSRGWSPAVRVSGYEQWRIGADGLIAESLGHFDSAEYQHQLDGRAK